MDDVRLIDANALIKEIESIHCPGCNSYNGVMCRACEWMDAMDYIEDAPTVDAVPAKYGKWVLQMDGCSLQKCSCCGYEYSDRIECYNFCGNCGADMRPGKTGKWIDRTLHHYYDYPKFICSICGKILEVDKKCLPCECPKCGADMRGGDSE